MRDKNLIPFACQTFFHCFVYCPLFMAFAFDMQKTQMFVGELILFDGAYCRLPCF